MADQKDTKQHAHAHPDELKAVLDWLREHGASLGMSVVLAVAVVLGVLTYRSHQASTERRASELLMRAQQVADFQVLLDQYGKTESAPMALISMASLLYQEGQYDEAMDVYHRFVETYPEHMLLPAASLGNAYCQEAKGLWESAHEDYQAFGSRFPDHSLVPLALFGEARTLAHMGRGDEAMALYQSYIDEHEDDDVNWAAQARTAKLYLEKELRAQKKMEP